MFKLFDTPWLLRIIPIIYGFCTLLTLYLTALKFFNRNCALICAIILLSTIPFLNFSWQVRGYGLSALLLSLIIYSCFSFIDSRKKSHLVLVFLLSAFLIYTIPSNIYAIIAILSGIGIYLIFSIFYKKSLSLKYIANEPGLQIIISLSLGVFLSFLFYLPVFSQVFLSKNSANGPSFHWPLLKYYIHQINYSMVSGRWLFAVISFLGFLLLIPFIKKNTLKHVILLSLCSIILIVPYVRGDLAPARVFSVYAPIYALVIGLGLYYFWSVFAPKEMVYNYFFIAMVAIGSFIFYMEEKRKIQNHILNDIKIGSRSQDLYYQYYAYHFRPLMAAKQIKELNDNKMHVLVDECEGGGIPFYLNKFNVPNTIGYYKPYAFDSLLRITDSLYVITNRPNFFTQKEKIKTEFLNKDLRFHNILYVRKK